jgi:hypothetical protein
LFLDRRPVVDRRLLTFFASPKKVSQKKATAPSLPLRGSRLCKSKNGKCPQLAFGSDKDISNPFSAMHKRQRQKRMAGQEQLRDCNHLGIDVQKMLDL